MRFEPYPYRYWRGPNGRRASAYGAVPWTSPQEKSLWQQVIKGWTVYDNKTNKIGRTSPSLFPTKAAAQQVCNHLNGETA